MISLIFMILAGLCQLGIYLYHAFLNKDLFIIVFFALNFLYYSAFYMLEYSIHSQRIQKSFLLSDYKGAVKKTLTPFSFFIIYVVGATAKYLLIDVFHILRPINDPTNLVAVILYIIYFTAVTITIIMTNMNIFKLQEGIIRQKEYTFNTLLVINIAFFIVLIFIPALIVRLWIFLFILFTFANIVYIIRLIKEYFYYRTDHLRLCLAFNEEIQEKRNVLFDKAIKSRPEEDVSILRSTMEQDILKSQRAILSSEYGVTGMMLLTVANNILKVENNELIIGHCNPIHEVKEFKHLNEQQIVNKILQRSFDLDRIGAADINSLQDVGEKAINTILKEKTFVIYDYIPTCYRGIQRFIGLYPVFDNEVLKGILAIFKDNSNYLFPEEEKVISSLVDDIRVILSIMEGKFIQQERNRLQGEMNIAKDIQLSILPRSIEIEGYDCACLMETATEVGGDAYDYVKSKFGHYLGIGDVSGHGLPAGIMALIQMAAFESSVFSAEEMNQDISPDKIYNVVNRVLCNINKDRIGSDKFMTQNYLIERDGSIIHAGTHTIALRYFEKEEKVLELRDFAKKTAFLGITPYIKSRDSLGVLTMNSGDILLLYTDGVIEAKNHYLKMFGLEKLKEIFRGISGLSAKEIAEKIREEVYNFAKDGDVKRHNGAYADDVSIVVMKKL
ncbi:MAG: SpoIIE family protein phosphatase [Spirochaetales bacterium]|nr:SpoIIE family protein phosphatase [Spirochaetales bacterium]